MMFLARNGTLSVFGKIREILYSYFRNKISSTKLKDNAFKNRLRYQIFPNDQI